MCYATWHAHAETRGMAIRHCKSWHLTMLFPLYLHDGHIHVGTLLFRITFKQMANLISQVAWSVTMFQPINLVAVQLTNGQRQVHKDGRHTAWFFPVYLSVSKCFRSVVYCRRHIFRKLWLTELYTLNMQTLILNQKTQPLNHENIVKSYFGHDRYTGVLDACEKVIWMSIPLKRVDLIWTSVIWMSIPFTWMSM